MGNYWFIGAPANRGSKFVLFASAFALVVILLGAYTRLTDAGLSCPDWPHCFGYITAPHTPEQLQQAAVDYPATSINVKKAWTEMTHRYFAGTEALLMLIVAFGMLLNPRLRNPKTTFISMLLIGLLCVQILLGRFTVTAQLKPAIVTAHLLTGVSILCVLWWTYLESLFRTTIYTRYSQVLIPWLWLGFLIMFAQISLGGWVSSHYAGLACIDFPYCNGKLIPTLNWNNFNTDLITIHMAHRLGALVTAIYMIILSLKLLTKPTSKSFGSIIILLLSLQLTLGVLNLVWLRPVFIAMMHQGVAIVLLLTTLTALVKAYAEAREARLC